MERLPVGEPFRGGFGDRPAGDREGTHNRSLRRWASTATWLSEKVMQCAA